jgi:hypothetical protein
MGEKEGHHEGHAFGDPIFRRQNAMPQETQQSLDRMLFLKRSGLHDVMTETGVQRAVHIDRSRNAITYLNQLQPGT